MKRYRCGAIVAILVLAGCGQMGPLVLPTGDATVNTPRATPKPVEPAPATVVPVASAPVQETP